jgi:hypothetical protein
VIDKDEIVYRFDKGYYDADETISIPDGAMISGSTNVIHNRMGKPVSFKGLTNAGSTLDKGGNRCFSLDANLVGLMGKNTSTKKAIGNMLQGIGRSLWFVGNSIGDSDAVRVMDSFGSPTAIGALSSTPQYAKFNGTGWNSPVQVGLAPQTDAAELILTTSVTRDSSFTGLITGSISGRIARKRNGAVSIASGASNVITGDADSFYMTIPDWTDDGSAQADRSWLLYFTFTGFGSQYAHLLFPIEIAESKLDGTDATGWTDTQGNAKIKVISQHASSQASRKVEIEFYNNDLLEIKPFEDYYSLGSCKFLAQIGNVMCGIGTGTDSTGFDVSYPNNREAFPPDWRDWFSEVPVSIAQSTEQGAFWVLGANSTNRLIWTGATQNTAPVIIEQISSRYGAIGEAASVSINGVLYFISKGGTPVRISQSKEVDDQFGTRVRNAFSAFDSTTQCGYDEKTNSFIAICGVVALAYQIDTDKWSAPVTLSTSGSANISAVFGINGKFYLSYYDTVPVTDTFVSAEWNLGSGAVNWGAISNFRTGKFGLSEKDIVEAQMVYEIEQTASQTITLYVCKNFSTSSPISVLAHADTSGVAGVKTSEEAWPELLEYETIALKASGALGGQTIHLANIGVQGHFVERLT